MKLQFDKISLTSHLNRYGFETDKLTQVLNLRVTQRTSYDPCQTCHRKCQNATEINQPLVSRESDILSTRN